MRSAGPGAAVLLVVLLLAPTVLTTYWVQTLTSVGVYSIVALSLALLMGRVGLVSLGQIALLAVGGWVALRLGFAFDLPFVVLLVVTGLITGVVGTLIGLPALRLSGLYLALITLMAAAAITQIIQATNFPNGGPGFLGYSGASSGSVAASIKRPELIASDAAYFRVVVVVAALMFGLAVLHVRGRAGRAWAAIRQSETAAIAAGVNVTLYKLWAFALASFMTGVAGCLLAASAGGLTTYAFPVKDPIILLAVVLMGGIYTFWGPIVAALLQKLVPELLKNWGLPPDLLLILFGIGVLQAMLTAPLGLAVQVPRDLANLGRALAGLAGPDQQLAKTRRVIEISDLTVRFGGVTPLDDVSLQLPAGTCGLIGPNGAGKTTLFNVLSGFVAPVKGSVRAFGTDLLGMPNYRRARWGLRRTFQTEQAIEALSIFDNVAMVHEHCSARGSARRAEVLAAIEFVGLEVSPNEKVGRLGARERRLVEIARAVVGEPRVVLLDEPAAGLPEEETQHLSRMIQRIPEDRGALVILVDHDMSLVSACCQVTAVLDFGKLIAVGPTAEVLRNDHVMRAYLGTEDTI